MQELTVSLVPSVLATHKAVRAKGGNNKMKSNFKLQAEREQAEKRKKREEIAIVCALAVMLIMSAYVPTF